MRQSCSKKLYKAFIQFSEKIKYKLLLTGASINQMSKITLTLTEMTLSTQRRGLRGVKSKTMSRNTAIPLEDKKKAC